MKRLHAVWTFALALGLSATAFATPLANPGWGLPQDASVDGYRVDWLIHSTMFFVVLLFVIMVIWMAIACTAHGRKHEAKYEHGDGRKQITMALSISALIFFVVDGNLFYHAMTDIGERFWNFSYAEAQPGAVRIEINAHQWAWQARYAGPDGKFNTQDDVVTLNDVRVPLGAPAIFELASTDVIHSFYLPNFRTKQDAMPGMINKLWFEPKETGEFDIGCAQHCGINHYKMKALLTVLPRADYERWLKEASANSARAWDPADTIAHWGWAWTNPKPIEGDEPLPAAATAQAATPSHQEGI
ncbi:MAG TPA: cytochrome C oxidase subunit II [Myxococcales bacterium]|nr:cytochrome C oxidase subunit II [Myxococcales bacterium]